MSKNYYAPYIDGLRAIAVLSVIAYHLNSAWLPGGFAGVDVFFVISGFVVSSSVYNLPRMGILSFMLHFYSRRLTRIVPALAGCLVLTALFAALFIPDAYLSVTNQRTGLAAFVGLSNILLMRKNSDYFSPLAEFNPYTHTWSLGVEEQFYFVFPLLFFAWLLARRRLAIGLFTAGVVASLAVSVWLAQTDQNSAFYLIWSRFWELAAGVLLFQWMAFKGHAFDRESGPSRIANMGAVISALVLLAGLWTAAPGHAPMPACILPVLGTLGLLGFVHGRPSGTVQRLLAQPTLCFIGRISYSLYLWHWPIFVLLRWTVGLESAGVRLAALFLTAACSIGSFYLIEKPTRRAGPRLPKPVAVATGLALIALGVALSALINAQQPQISLSVVARDRLDWYGEPKPKRPASDCSVELTEVSIGVPHSKIARSNCSEQPVSAQRLFVVGDSHAGAYEFMLKKFALQTGIDVHLYTRGGCPFVGLGTKPELEAGCVRHTAAVVADILSSARRDDQLFLPALRIPRLADQWVDFGLEAANEDMHGVQARLHREAAERAAGPLLRQFTDKGVRVILEAPKPVYRTVPYRCSDWFNRTNPICVHGDSIPRPVIEALRQPVLDAFARLAANNSAVRIWDPLPVLCDTEVCSTKRAGVPLFFDGDHLSGRGNDMLLPSFLAFVMEPTATRPD